MNSLKYTRYCSSYRIDLKQFIPCSHEGLGDTHTLKKKKNQQIQLQNLSILQGVMLQGGIRSGSDIRKTAQEKSLGLSLDICAVILQKDSEKKTENNIIQVWRAPQQECELLKKQSWRSKPYQIMETLLFRFKNFKGS